MATINLGAIKFNWKGAYNSSTSYAVDDVVSSGGNSYVCIQAHSNQAVGNATAYWNIMSSAGSNGTNGTNGTDVGTTITTQGDILYRDGSGLARLGYGTAGQVLQTGGSGANPSWGTVSSDFVKIVSQESENFGANNFSLQNCFDDSTYKGYQLTVGYNMNGTNGDRLIVRYLDSSNNELGTSGNQYRRAGGQAYQQTDGNASTMGAWNDASGRNDFDLFNWQCANSTAIMNYATCNFDRNLNRASSVYPNAIMENSGIDNSSPQYYFRSHATIIYVGGTNVTGMKFFTSNSQNIGRLSLQLYGRK